MSHADEHADQRTGSRRDFLYYATGAAGLVVTGAAVWPLVNQMNPTADVQALASIEVDISGLEPGTQLTVLWLGKPVFIRRRTPEEIEAARGVDLAELPDPIAQNANLEGPVPATDANRSLAPFGAVDAGAEAGEAAEGADGSGEWLVMMGVCTHLGCVPLGDAGDFAGWFCPCHGSHYDTAGRVRRGPAPTNLPIPVAAFTSDTTIRLG